MPELKYNPTKFESLFDNFILNEVEVIHSDKVIKRGQLKLVSVKNHIIKLYFIQNSILKNIELYYPFDVTVTDNCIILDYSIKKFARNNILLYAYTNTYKQDEPSDILDTKIYIKKI